MCRLQRRLQRQLSLLHPMRIIVLSSLTRCIRLEFPAVAVWLMMTGSTFLTSSSKGYGQVNWSARFSGIGTFSSPRVTDLNGDGTGEVILGAGREEFKACDSAVTALDGKTGKMLWHIPAIDQVFGSPAFL